MWIQHTILSIPEEFYSLIVRLKQNHPTNTKKYIWYEYIRIIETATMPIDDFFRNPSLDLILS